MSFKLTVSGLVAAAGLCTAAYGQTTFPETEPNDTKAVANGPFAMAAGDIISGLTTGSSTTAPGSGSADNFIVKTAPAAAGIYRHRMVITTLGAAGHTGTIRGLTQTAGAINAGTDAAVQTSSTTTTPPRFVQWYGFGKEEQVYFRITGSGTTTSDYAATLETATVALADAGTYRAGSITISRGGGITTDTDFWVYDENFNAIPDFGNDNPNTMTRTFTSGTYYIAYSNTNVANNQPAASGDTNLTASVLDFADAVANSSTSIVANMPIRIADQFGAVDTSAAKSGPYDIVWVKFEVDKTNPVVGACCFANGTCSELRGTSCAIAGGVYSGDGVACATANCPQPGACCLPEFTCQILSSGECTTAGGVYQGNGSACALCPTAPAGSVALVFADGTTNPPDVKAKLEATGLFPAVVMRNVQTPRPTPTLADLSQFSAVMIWTNQSFSDGAAMGDVMADYIDAGGGVVVNMFTLGTATANRFLGGRWDAAYEIIPEQGGNTSGGGEQSLGTVLVPGHPILAGVNTFSGGASSFRPTSTAMNPHGQLIAQWTDGKTLIATSSTLPRRVDLGMFPPSTTVTSTGWNPTTDGARLMANALLYAGRNLNMCYPNCDGSTTAPILNVQDFACFLNAFASGESYANCDGSTTAPILNVQDFACFLNAFAVGCS
jgi:hypothetical protein